MGRRGVLMLAYGSPDSLDDIEAYLSDIRGGRPMSEAFVDEFRGRYAQIGGKSPLAERTCEQARETERCLRDRGFEGQVYVGMRHWKPWIRDAIAQMRDDGVQEAAAIVMAPHYSSMSIGRYWDRVMESQDASAEIDFLFVNSWCSQPKLLAAQVRKAREGLAKFGSEERVKVIFTAHSLPSRLLDMGDPYDSELKANAKAIAEQLDGLDWTFSYQSAAKTGEPWLGPQIEDLIADLAEEGQRNLLLVPIGFVCDHIEVLYDIDIGCRQIATHHGVRLERTESMNADPEFIEAVADAVEERLAEF